MIKAVIVGGTGYAGAEIIRLLVNHPEVEIEAITSTSYKDTEYHKVYPGMYKCINMECSEFHTSIDNCDVVFAALPHGLSEEIGLECYKKDKVFIDLGADFRLYNEEDYKTWYGKEFIHKELHKYSQYGLPELHREKIKNSKIIGNPGCYPTSILLGLAPVLESKLIELSSIIIDSKSGVTGAGRSLDLGSHFCECNDSIKAYKIGGHRHISEIEQEISDMSEEKTVITFTPHLVPMNRGILSTIYCKLKDKANVSKLHELYTDFYKNEKFVRILEEGKFPETRFVRYSNYCDIGIAVDKRTNRLIIVSAIDNMVKGAAGQAIQNMNIIFGFEENLGLNLIPGFF